MSEYFDAFKINSAPVTDKEHTVIHGRVRISVLTDSLVRVERSPSGRFCDSATQSVWFRNFSQPAFSCEIKGNNIIIKTEKAEFCCNSSGGSMKYIRLSDGRRITDYRSGNLKGTARTLDFSFGSVRLGDGIMSRNGVSVLDDSASLIIRDDGTAAPRESKESDRYYFAYGNDYRRALADFFRLTGAPPLIPRFALGNWWSRYKAYTQEEYLTLMKRFVREEIPVSVATVDMDWHWVDVKKQFGRGAYSLKGGTLASGYYDAFSKGGWTGYSWNTELFPDYREFLKTLHDMNFKVTLNLHPASGVRPFEDCYDSFARFMGDSPEEKKSYPFDITDKKFTEGYFSILHKPYEREGVDFWWIDWQQGNRTAVKGLDPLWALNHYHSLDIARDGKRRPLILSRFAGAGSHRYPLGFSGDTAQNWRVLDFQPYFTSTASNIGYTWWSHDIGGHHYGRKDDELYLRWVQFGVFSPVMRLHSTSNEFMGKEPWKYSRPIERLTVDALRFRHRLIPYIYSANYRTHFEGRALIEPVYYAYPDAEQAYSCKNEYMFGSELIVCPITSPISSKTGMAAADMWLPEGRFTDIFTGRIYKGGRIKMFRDISSVPVLAREGAIIPLDMNDRTNDCRNPESMELLIYRGNNSFTLFEDDGESMNYENGAYAKTVFSVSERDGTLEFTISPCEGDSSVLPERRSYTLSFRDIVGCESYEAVINSLICDKEILSTASDGTLVITLNGICPQDGAVITLRGITTLKNTDKREALIDCISKFRIRNNSKKRFTDYVNGRSAIPRLPACLREPLREIENLYYY